MFLNWRVVVTRPGSEASYTDGSFRSIRCSGSVRTRSICAGVTSNVRPGSTTPLRSTRPAPSSKTPAGVTPSCSTTLRLAVIISTDFTWAGLKPGCSASTSAADPVMCGAAIDVPAIAWKSCPAGPDATSVGVGVLPARICTPGAVMSGFRKPSPPGPREENAAMTSPWPTAFCPVVNVAVEPG